MVAILTVWHKSGHIFPVFVKYRWPSMTSGESIGWIAHVDAAIVVCKCEAILRAMENRERALTAPVNMPEERQLQGGTGVSEISVV